METRLNANSLEIVWWLVYHATKLRLLKEGNLDMSKALNICRASEIATQQLKARKIEENKTEDVRAISSRQGNKGKSRKPFNGNIGTWNVYELFWMLQCNLTKNDESTFFVLNIDWVFVQNWVLPYINENAKRSAAPMLMLYIHFPLSFPVTFGASSTNY